MVQSLQLSDQLATDLGLNNANIKLDGTSSTSLVIKNKDDFDSTVSKDYTEARTAGSFNNDVKVVVVDHAADQRVTVTPAAGQILTVDTVGAADSNRSQGSYTIGASDYTAAGAGTGATFTIAVDGNGAATVTVTGGGTGYAENDTITVADAQLGGGGGAALTFDVNTVGSPLPAAGTYLQWTWMGNVYKGNVYKTIGANQLEVTLWDSTKRLTGNEVLKTAVM